MASAQSLCVKAKGPWLGSRSPATLETMPRRCWISNEEKLRTPLRANRPQLPPSHQRSPVVTTPEPLWPVGPVHRAPHLQCAVRQYASAGVKAQRFPLWCQPGETAAVYPSCLSFGRIPYESSRKQSLAGLPFYALRPVLRETWSGLRESNPCKWLGRPRPDHSAKPALNLVDCQGVEPRWPEGPQIYSLLRSPMPPAIHLFT